MTGCGVPSEWLREDVSVSNILSTASTSAGTKCKEWALRHLGLLLTPQEEALLEDLGPVCWRVGAKFTVDRTQDVIFQRDHHLPCEECGNS